MTNFRTEDDANELWSNLKIVIKKEKKDLGSIAKDIGISLTALRTFMERSRDPHIKTIGKIEEYVELKGF